LKKTGAFLQPGDSFRRALAIKAAAVGQGGTMINDFIIFTDAAADLPTKLIETHKIFVLPMHFEINGKSHQHYPDGRELGYSEFYQMLRSGITATTSQQSTCAVLNLY
jgi:fatty acid-binding protein DegV